MEREMKRQHSSPERRRVILCGHGSMGSIFADVVQGANVEIVAVVRSTEALRTALETMDVEGVVISSPRGFHEEQVLLCSGFGKKILCEKPLGLSVESAKKVNAAINVSGFQRRVDVNFARAFAQLKEIGQLQLIRVISRDPPSDSPRSVESIVFDSLIHDVDLACWFAQSGKNCFCFVAGGFASQNDCFKSLLLVILSCLVSLSLR
jgi:predicted dehydrogenase